MTSTTELTTPASPTLSKDSSQWRILVVDDEQSVAEVFRRTLAQLPNCEVQIATSGEQALQMFSEQPFHLLLTDYKMPLMDGIKLAARVREAYPLTGVVIVTAYRDERLGRLAAPLKIQAILDKPANLSELRTTAVAALATSRVSALTSGDRP